ncbi:MAG: hypothetical protein V4467_04155 [Patescibacteria group bacterium]
MCITKAKVSGKKEKEKGALFRYPYKSFEKSSEQGSLVRASDRPIGRIFLPLSIVSAFETDHWRQFILVAQFPPNGYQETDRVVTIVTTANYCGLHSNPFLCELSK